MRARIGAAARLPHILVPVTPKPRPPLGIVPERTGKRPPIVAREHGFSILFDSSRASSQDKVLQKLAEHVASAPQTFVARNHMMAIIASQDVATWLQDQSFMASMVTLLSTSQEQERKTVDVLAAVSDSVLSTNETGHAHKGGFSIMAKHQNAVPSLWPSGTVDGEKESDEAASLTFHAPPINQSAKHLEITVPLANTIFQNGRRSTLFASQWDRDEHGYMRLTKREYKQSQAFLTPMGPETHSIAAIPLEPLAAPRKIVAGLGNIVRQVEIDGATVPASKELEELIPKLITERAAAGVPRSSGPIGVWAWIIPSHVLKAEQLAVPGLRDLSNKVDRMLSGGCTLHRILSGGGGWGAKQGLLSLDPDTSYAQPEQDDIDAFVKAFEGREDPHSSSGGLASAGSYIWFCVESERVKRSVDHTKRSLDDPPALSFGIPLPVNEEKIPKKGPKRNAVKLVEGEVGIRSTAGFFLKSRNGLTEAASSTAWSTRIDVPGASLRVIPLKPDELRGSSSDEA